jgi:hypothetical protein
MLETGLRKELLMDKEECIDKTMLALEFADSFGDWVSGLILDPPGDIEEKTVALALFQGLPSPLVQVVRESVGLWRKRQEAIVSSRGQPRLLGRAKEAVEDFHDDLSLAALKYLVGCACATGSPPGPSSGKVPFSHPDIA